MFVNLNTKGKPLSEIEILKSKLFKYLLSKKNSDIYKEKWQEMLNNIPDKEYATFVSDTYLFYVFQTKNDVIVYTASGTGVMDSALSNMVNEGDKIAVALSGGKDSLTLLLCLDNMRKWYPQKFDIVAVTIDPGGNIFDTTELEAF